MVGLAKWQLGPKLGFKTAGLEFGVRANSELSTILTVARAG